jgi:hypothetical protein
VLTKPQIGSQVNYAIQDLLLCAFKESNYMTTRNMQSVTQQEARKALRWVKECPDEHLARLMRPVLLAVCLLVLALQASCN